MGILGLPSALVQRTSTGLLRYEKMPIFNMNILIAFIFIFICYSGYESYLDSIYFLKRPFAIILAIVSYILIGSARCENIGSEDLMFNTKKNTSVKD